MKYLFVKRISATLWQMTLVRKLVVWQLVICHSCGKQIRRRGGWPSFSFYSTFFFGPMLPGNRNALALRSGGQAGGQGLDIYCKSKELSWMESSAYSSKHTLLPLFCDRFSFLHCKTILVYKLQSSSCTTWELVWYLPEVMECTNLCGPITNILQCSEKGGCVT